MAAKYQIIVRAGPNAGKAYPLEAPEVTIGRDNSNMIAINDAEVSRKHALLRAQGDGYLIIDNGSTNGTTVNGQPVSGARLLRPGEVIALGETVQLAYETAFDPNATLVSPRNKDDVTESPIAPAPEGPAAGRAPAAQPAVKPKKKNKLLVILLIVAAAIIACCGIAWLTVEVLNLYCYLGPLPQWFGWTGCF